MERLELLIKKATLKEMEIWINRKYLEIERDLSRLADADQEEVNKHVEEQNKADGYDEHGNKVA